MTRDQKILVSAYACEPGLGSEIGVGWHWVLEMSKYMEIWVLTRESNRRTIEPWIREHPEYGGIHFLYFDLPQWARRWKKGLSGVRTYYMLWQWRSNSLVKRTMREHGIRLFHHLTYGNALWPVSRYGRRQTFIWGPIGGVETVPQEYSRHYEGKSRLLESVRRFAVHLLPWNHGFRKRCRRATLILCKTEAMRMAVPEPFRGKALLFTDVAVEKAGETEETASRPEGGEKIEYLVVGRLDAWRGFDVLVEAFSAAVRKNPRIHLTIVGKGQDEPRLRRLMASHGAEEHITMAGSIPMEDYRRTLRECDVVMNSSLREGAVTVSFDSLAMGKPLICVDTGGYTRYFTEEYAVVLPRESREKLVEALSEAILRLTDDGLRRNMGKAALEAGSRFTWEQKGKDIQSAVNSIL